MTQEPGDLRLIVVESKIGAHGENLLDDDYDVRLGDATGKLIGRILWTYGPSRQTPWYWTITVPVQRAPIRSGYAATREEAISAFEAAYKYNEVMLKR